MKKNVSPIKNYSLILAFLLLTSCTPNVVSPIVVTPSLPSTVFESYTPSPAQTSTEIDNQIISTQTDYPLSTPTIGNPMTSTPLTHPLLAIAYLDGPSLIVECLEKGACIQNFDLSQINLPGSSFRLGSVHYLNPVNIFAWVYSDETNNGAVLRINLDTEEVKSIDLPSASLEGMIAHERLVFRDYKEV